MRCVKHIENCNWVVNFREIIPNYDQRVLWEGPKTDAKTVPGRPQMTEQSMDRRPFDTPSKGVVVGDMYMGE